jgi:hypothetical protein
MIQILSYGGGLDSFALLLAAQERASLPDVAVFVDVGDGSARADGSDPAEWPGTYRHMREVVMPLCASLGVPFVWLSSDAYPVRDARSLFAWFEARRQIPVSGPNRICTTVAKVERFERWLADRYPGEAAEVWLGFEAGEEARAAKDPNAGKPGRRHNRFPLIEWGMCRCRCEALVRASGYPVPRKSACVFCPYGTKADWKTFARELPEHFARTVALEADKPLTRNGAKLSIRGFRTVTHDDGTKTYKHTPLPVYVLQPERRRPPVACEVCGAPERATKATGCGYLEAS